MLVGEGHSAPVALRLGTVHLFIKALASCLHLWAADIMAARLGWGGGLPRPARGGEAGEGEAGGGEEAAAEEHWDGLEEEMHAAFTEIGALGPMWVAVGGWCTGSAVTATDWCSALASA